MIRLSVSVRNLTEIGGGPLVNRAAKRSLSPSLSGRFGGQLASILVLGVTGQRRWRVLFHGPRCNGIRSQCRTSPPLFESN